MRRTANPALNAGVFQKERTYGLSEAMTIQGTVNKSLIMLILLVISAAWVWGKAMPTQAAYFAEEYGRAASTSSSNAGGYMMAGALLGFIVALVTIFKKKWAMFTAPIYAILQGMFIGGISAMFELQFPGIVMQAVALTFGVLFSLLMVYKSGLIKVTDNFRMGIFAATGGICLVYLVSIIMGVFGKSLPFLHTPTPMGIGISVFIVIIAALNLVLDFDFIEKGSEMGAPKYMEWYGAFGLMVTLVWLYIEILRLLVLLNSRK